MRTKFYLDKRIEVKALAEINKNEREYPIKIAINHKGSSAYLPTGVSVQISQWQSKPGVGQIVNTAKAARLNIVLSEKKLAVDKIIEDLRASGELHGATASEIREKVQRKLELDSYGTDNGETPVLVCFDKFIGTKTRRRTIQVYEVTKAKLQSYGDFTEKTTFCSITPSWLVGFDAFLAKTNPSANARSIYIRNIRAVFNYALAEDLTQATYPFRRFKIKDEPTKDRSLTPEDLRKLHETPCNPTTQKYKDLFFLSFFMCGMNLEDILAIKEVKGGRVEVRRIKTGQPLTIRLEPEALAIINKYKGTERLFSIGQGINYENFQHRLNHYLKDIGKVYNPHSREWEGEALFPELSYYYARYSWATIAAELDIPERTIGFALGHSTSKSVTSIYTRVDMRKKIDAANRKVIDYVFPKNLESKK